MAKPGQSNKVKLCLQNALFKPQDDKIDPETGETAH